jgi:hypothetical protein
MRKSFETAQLTGIHAAARYRALPRNLSQDRRGRVRNLATLRRRASLRCMAYAGGIVLAMLCTGFAPAGAYARGLHAVTSHHQAGVRK